MAVLWWAEEDLPDFVKEACSAPAMTRIRKIDMNCGMNYTSFPIFAGIAPYTRFEHSLGVGCITWKLTENPAAALAGLFHDIAAPAFSHTVDFARGDYAKQEATEDRTAELIRRDPVIRRVLSGLGLSAWDVFPASKYKVADCSAPGLCADRLEYTLGNMVNYGFARVEEAKSYWENVTAGRNEKGEEEIVFRDAETAVSFAKRALQCGRIYSCENDRYGMEILAELLREALSRGILLPEDLYTTEPLVIRKLEASPLRQKWERFRSMKELEISRKKPQSGEEGWRCLHVKKRWIDPLGPGGVRASRMDPSFRKDLDTFLLDDQNVWLRDKIWQKGAVADE